MSRHLFSKVVSNCDAILEKCDNEFDEIVANLDEEEEVPDSCEPKDIKGYSLYDWQNYGVVGWDEMLSTYFVQLIFREGEPDEHGWWIGTRESEMPDFLSLCEMLNKIFDVPRGFFEYVDCIARP